VVVLAHYDTVWPRGTAHMRPFSVVGGVARGPGVFDMRGGIVAALNAVEALSELRALRRPVEMLITADEEIGSTTSRDLIVELDCAAALVLVPEPPLGDGRLKTRRKGLFTYRVSVRGRSAHAGLDPGRGVSAIHELLDLVQCTRRLAEPRSGTTVNVGVIGGGTRPNVVAEEAFAEIDIRVTTAAEGERIEAWFRDVASATPGARLAVERLHMRPAMERTPAIGRAFERARTLSRELGIELTEGAAGGASDANLVAPYGVPVLDGLGPCGGGAHAVDERVIIQSLVERVALIGLLAAHP
jgi:glutamate carboxypeptidase